MITYGFTIGGSMSPALGWFNIIKVSKRPEYKVGDIVSLKTHDKVFHCHRITAIDSEYVSTKGDNLEQKEYEIKVPRKNIEGAIDLILKVF